MLQNVRADRLSITECKSFFEHFLSGLLKTGLLEPLKTYNKGPKAVISASRSLYEALAKGMSIQDSLRAMSPRFPSCVEELLSLSAERSILDRTLSDLVKIYDNNDSEESLLDAVSKILDLYRSSPKGEKVCQECFERDFLKILKRAALEKAGKVILKQEAEFFFHQIYMGTKPIHVTESCNSMLYNTILQHLKDAVDSGKISIGKETFFIKRIGDNRYSVKGKDQKVVFIFQ